MKVGGFMAVLAIALTLGASGGAQATERPGVSHSPSETHLLDRLARQPTIPLTTISADGSKAAYLVVEPDPKTNTYHVSVFVAWFDKVTSPTKLRSYFVDPDAVYDELSWFKREGGELKWISEDDLLYSYHTERGASLALWEATSRRTHHILGPFESVVLEDGKPNDVPRVITTEPKLRASATSRPIERDWRITDENSLYGPISNPRRQGEIIARHWRLSIDGPNATAQETSSTVQWKVSPRLVDRIEVGPAQPEEVHEISADTSPDGAKTVRISVVFNNMAVPKQEIETVRVELDSNGVVSRPIPDRRSLLFQYERFLGWSGDGDIFYLLEVGPSGSDVIAVSDSGISRIVYHSDGRLEIACPRNRSCRNISEEGNYVLLTESDRESDNKIIRVNFTDNTARILYVSERGALPISVPSSTVYPLGKSGAGGWARLFVPRSNFKPPYPLVITQYVADPGYPISTGDEVPIYALANSGIAVLMVNTGLYNVLGAKSKGSLQLEVDRLAQPVDAMKSLVGELSADGIVDPNRVALTGLSYGAEVALFALWQWPELSAVSVGNGAWDPATVTFGGPWGASELTNRGLPGPFDEAGWARLSLTSNTGKVRTPLLFQTSDGEANLVVPLWTALRRANVSVEWFEFIDEGHVKVNPAARLQIYTRNFDWLTFWLLGRIDSDPNKKDQYVRWSAMRP